MLRDKKERRRLLKQQSELYFNHCEGCKHLANNSYCNNHCPIGEQMKEIGRALGFNKEPSFRKIEVSKDEYIKLRDQGLSNKQIADHFGVSVQLILNRRRDWGISGKRDKPYVLKAPEVTKEQIQAAQDEGLTLAATAKRLHISRSKLISLRRKYGLADPKDINRHRPEYERLRAQGLPIVKIAQKMDVNKETVMRWRRSWGLKGDD